MQGKKVLYWSPLRLAEWVCVRVHKRERADSSGLLLWDSCAHRRDLWCDVFNSEKFGPQ